jgi:hypothetical protein
MVNRLYLLGCAVVLAAEWTVIGLLGYLLYVTL